MANEDPKKNPEQDPKADEQAAPAHEQEPVKHHRHPHAVITPASSGVAHVDPGAVEI